MNFRMNIVFSLFDMNFSHEILKRNCRIRAPAKVYFINQSKVYKSYFTISVHAKIVFQLFLLSLRIIQRAFCGRSSVYVPVSFPAKTRARRLLLFGASFATSGRSGTPGLAGGIPTTLCCIVSRWRSSACSMLSREYYFLPRLRLVSPGLAGCTPTTLCCMVS
jgi:hypothetical protein